jgi:flagellar biosynthesis protein FliR
MAEKRRMTPEEARRDHEQMLRFMAKRFALGATLGLVCAALVFLVDIGGLGTRISHTDNPFLPVFLIAVPMGLTFGAVMVCIALWVLPYENKFAEDYEGRDPF